MSRLSLLVLLLALNFPSTLCALPPRKEFYQLKIYHIKTEAQEAIVDNFLAKAYLPAAHRLGVSKIGVFKPVSTPALTPAEKLVYVFVPFRSYEEMKKFTKKLGTDEIYLTDGKSYLDALYTHPPYERIETIFMDAFQAHPKFSMPKLNGPKVSRIYELRSYESRTEAIAKNKIDMFNKGDEIGLFDRLGFNAVFYGEVVAGSRMPNLMYLTTFENKTERDAHWKAFGADAFWKTLSNMPVYKNNVAKNDTKFLYPTDYSDI